LGWGENITPNEEKDTSIDKFGALHNPIAVHVPQIALIDGHSLTFTLYGVPGNDSWELVHMLEW
jgi:hypothetical protein